MKPPSTPPWSPPRGCTHSNARAWTQRRRGTRPHTNHRTVRGRTWDMRRGTWRRIRIHEQTEILCLVVTPGDQCTRNNIKQEWTKNTSTKSPRTSMVRRAGETSSCVTPRRWKSTMAAASYNTHSPSRRETSTGSARNSVPSKRAMTATGSTAENRAHS